jgi:transcriptional regulator with XRE-family HTH domain
MTVITQKMTATPLRKARMARGLTQEQVAQRVQIHQGSYSRIERADPHDRTSGVTSDLAKQLVKLFRHQGLTELHILYPHRREFRNWEPS